MIQLPKKRPWVLIILFYLLVIGGWVAFYMLAINHSGNKRSAEETEALMKAQQEESSTPQATPQAKSEDD